jgi:hypothetical protein
MTTWTGSVGEYTSVAYRCCICNEITSGSVDNDAYRYGYCAPCFTYKETNAYIRDWRQFHEYIDGLSQ